MPHFLDLTFENVLITCFSLYYHYFSYEKQKQNRARKFFIGISFCDDKMRLIILPPTSLTQ